MCYKAGHTKDNPQYMLEGFSDRLSYRGEGTNPFKRTSADYEDNSLIVSGEQTGVKNAKDTAKATDALKLRRKKEKSYDPNMSTLYGFLNYVDKGGKL